MPTLPGPLPGVLALVASLVWGDMFWHVLAMAGSKVVVYIGPFQGVIIYIYIYLCVCVYLFMVVFHLHPFAWGIWTSFYWPLPMSLAECSYKKRDEKASGPGLKTKLCFEMFFGRSIWPSLANSSSSSFCSPAKCS